MMVRTVNAASAVSRDCQENGARMDYRDRKARRVIGETWALKVLRVWLASVAVMVSPVLWVLLAFAVLLAISDR